jgi:hypothetical protein
MIPACFTEIPIPDIYRRSEMYFIHEANHDHLRLGTSPGRLTLPSQLSSHNHIPWCSEIAGPNSKPDSEYLATDQHTDLIILLGSVKTARVG